MNLRCLILLSACMCSHTACTFVGMQEGHTALHWATMCGHVEAVEELLQGASDPNALSKVRLRPS